MKDLVPLLLPVLFSLLLPVSAVRAQDAGSDPVPANTVWRSETGQTLIIVERKDDAFRGVFTWHRSNGQSGTFRLVAGHAGS